MSKPVFHAQSSAKKFGGKWEDYIDIHNFMDSSKGAIADNRHRALTHNSWFLSVVLEEVFGVARFNSDGDQYSVRDIGEQHVLEDFGMRFIPTAQDYLEEINFKDWMNNGRVGTPSSHRKINETRVVRQVEKPIVFDGASKTIFGPDAGIHTGEDLPAPPVSPKNRKVKEGTVVKPMTFD